MKSSPNKTLLFSQVVESLEEKLRVLKQNAIDAKEASTNEESKAENKYDTRGLEASYLAQGQAARVLDLEKALYNLKRVVLKTYEPDTPIGISALVEVVNETDEKKWFFVVPANGVTLRTETIVIQTTSLDSPMGEALLGLRAGEDFSLNGREYEIMQCL